MCSMGKWGDHIRQNILIQQNTDPGVQYMGKWRDKGHCVAFPPQVP